MPSPETGPVESLATPVSITSSACFFLLNYNCIFLITNFRCWGITQKKEYYNCLVFTLRMENVVVQ
jgi:hypothetical protein